MLLFVVVNLEIKRNKKKKLYILVCHQNKILRLNRNIKK